MRGGADVLGLAVLFVVFLLGERSFTETGREREKGGIGHSQYGDRGVWQFCFCFFKVDPCKKHHHICLILVHPSELDCTVKLSSLYKRPTQTPPRPQQPINQSVEHKKGQINERCVGTSGELKLVSKHSGTGMALVSATDHIHVIINFSGTLCVAICASVQPTCPGNAKALDVVQMKMS